MMLIFADRGIQSGWSADSIQSTLEGIEEKFEKCNDKLASVSVGPCSYQFQADKIERMTQDLQLLQSYASSAPDYVWETLDNPLYVDFKNNATESLSQIILDDFYTDNTIGMEEHFTVSQKGAVYSRKRVKETLTFSDFFGLPAVEHEDSMVTLENVETVNEFASLFRKDYDKMKEADIETCIRNYLTSGEFNHEAYHPARDFLSGLLDITIVKPVIEFFTGTDLITGERLTEAQKYQKMAGAIVDMFTFGQGLAAMKGAGLVGKELCKAFGKTMLVEVASSASAYTVGYGVEAMGLPPQIAWMLGAATGCIVSTAGMNLVFRNPKTGVVRECSLEEITSLEKLDASEIDIAKLGKEVPTDDLELYMRYQKEGSIEHFTDGEKKTISRIETMGIKGDECEEILRARGKEVTRPPIEEPEKVLPPRNESGGKGGTPIQGYSNFADGMSPEDAARYIANNEKAFFNEFSERASVAGVSDTQIAESFEAMRNGDYAKMATYFDTSSPVDGAVFWSGNKEGAAAYANSIGGTIMEQTPGGQVFDNWRGLGGMYPEWDTPTNLAQKPIWDALSSQYANGAEGIATYVHPDGYVGKVWSNIEKPILEENNIIIQEVIIDAK